MRKPSDIRPSKRQPSFGGEVGAQEARKLKARRQPEQSAWFGFRMFGIVGWSVAVPTFLGALLGRWLDDKYPGRHSWTLTLLIVGLCLGCLAAWRWIARENKSIHDDTEDHNE